MTESIGDRIAVYRKRKGMSQAQLAGLVGRSESWLSQVERGLRSVDKLSVLTDLAHLLGVDVETLAGRPWRYAPNGGPELSALGAIRSALTSYSHLIGERGTMWPIPQLNAAVVETHRSYQAARYADTAANLPDLLHAVDSYSDRTRELHLARTSTYAVAAKLLTKVGESHLAWICADRAVTAALHADSITSEGLAAYQLACALLRAERVDEAERIAVASAERLMSHVRKDDPEAISYAGALWLIGSIIAARRVDRPELRTRLENAQRLADKLGKDANHGWTAFGPTNVAIHRTSAAAEMGEPLDVLNTATMIDTSAMPEGLVGRRSVVHLELAWAQVQRRHDPEAVLHLLEVERIAPETLRFHVVARELIREMLKRERRNRTPALRQIAMRAGILN